MHVEARHLAALRGILTEHIPGTTVWAFGSRVTGVRIKPFSDLDIAIMSDEPLGVRRIAFLKDSLSESNLPFKVDVVEWATLSPALRLRVSENHEQILPPTTVS